MENLHIKQNQGNTHYEVKDLRRDNRFLSFLYRFRSDKPKRVNINISQNPSFPGDDECELVSKGKRLSFLLTNDLEKDLDYFKEEYLPQLPKKRLSKRDCQVERISLLDCLTSEYEILVSSRELAEYPNPNNYWVEEIESVSLFNLVQLWTNLNSFYRQYSSDDTTPSALTYLKVIQEFVANAGTRHLNYEGSVMTDERYPIGPELFKIQDPSLRENEVSASSYVRDLRQAVFFNPSVHWRLLDIPTNPDHRNVRVKSSNLLDVKIK